MPPRGVEKGTKRARQYEHIKDAARAGPVRGHGRGDRGAHRQQGASAARRVADGVAPLPRGHLLGPAGRATLAPEGPRGRTRDQLYEEAKDRNVKGRSKMTKAQLARAVGRG